MRTLLQQVVAEVEKLPGKEQDDVSLRFLAELADDKKWDEQFAATTDEQWERMVAYVDKQIEAGGLVPLEDFLNELEADAKVVGDK